MKLLFKVVVACVACVTSCTHRTADTAVFTDWQAGTTVDSAQVAAFGVDRCFVAADIDSATFERINGRSYKPYCTIPVSRLDCRHKPSVQPLRLAVRRTSYGRTCTQHTLCRQAG